MIPIIQVGQLYYIITIAAPENVKQALMKEKELLLKVMLQETDMIEKIQCSSKPNSILR